MTIEQILISAREAEQDWNDLGDQENAGLIKALADRLVEFVAENRQQMQRLADQSRSVQKIIQERDDAKASLQRMQEAFVTMTTRIDKQIAVLDKLEFAETAKIAAAVNSIDEANLSAKEVIAQSNQKEPLI